MEGDVMHIVLGGKITAPSDYSALHAIIDEQVSSGIKKFVFNIGSVSFINSGGLGTLFQLAKVVNEEGGGITLYQVDAQLRELFNITLLDKKIPVCDSKNSAIEALK